LGFWTGALLSGGERLAPTEPEGETDSPQKKRYRTIELKKSGVKSGVQKSV